MPLVSITRDELHHIVWLKPLQELSSMLGITGERLEELCVLLRMPYPRSHYWKRLRAGERVVKFQLPKPAPETPGSATLQLAHVSARELDALKNATLLHATAPELRTKTAPKIHPIIAAWHASFRGLQRQYKSDRAAFHWSACDLRKHKILDQIFTAVEKDGYVVEEGRRRENFSLSRSNIKLHFRLFEARVRVKNPKDTYPSFELERSGKLRFEIRRYFNPDFPIPRKWEDTEDRDLGVVAPEIISTLLQAGAELALYERRMEELARQSTAAKLLHLEQEAQRKADDDLWLSLIRFADRMYAVDRIERLVSALEANTDDRSIVVGTRSLREWFLWARTNLMESSSHARDPVQIFGELLKISNAAEKDSKTHKS